MLERSLHWISAKSDNPLESAMKVTAALALMAALCVLFGLASWFVSLPYSLLIR